MAQLGAFKARAKGRQDREFVALGIGFSSAEKAVKEWQAVPYQSLLVDV